MGGSGWHLRQILFFVTSQSTQSSLTQVVGGRRTYRRCTLLTTILAPVNEREVWRVRTIHLDRGKRDFNNALWQQAAAEGITVVVAAGDSGSAGCDSSFTENAATNGLAVSRVTASTPYNVAVGGTGFRISSINLSNYWTPDKQCHHPALGTGLYRRGAVG